MQNANDILVSVGDRLILRTSTALHVSQYLLYGMVNSIMVVKSGAGQPLVNPGQGRWLVVKLPHGQAQLPDSHDAVAAGNYEINFYQQGLQGYPRPEIQQLNWEREGPAIRDGDKFRNLIRAAYTGCAITGTPLSTGVEAAHICPASTNFQIWNALAQYAFHEDVQMTAQFIQSASNGVLLRADVHAAFDAYALTVVQDLSKWWSWKVFAVDPAFAQYTGGEFTINRPADDGDRKRLVCTLQLHFMYATQKFAGVEFPV